MLKKIFILCVIAFASLNAKSQLTKSSWLLGGNIRFSSVNKKTDYPPIKLDVTIRNLDLSVKIGYFVEDKFSLGLMPSYIHKSYQTTKENSYLVGPFVRYYFLNIEKPFNVLAESSYQIGRFSSTNLIKNFSERQFTFAAGPALIFNSTITGEFLVSYFDNRHIFNTSKGLQVSIGLQIHLEN